MSRQGAAVVAAIALMLSGCGGGTGDEPSRAGGGSESDTPSPSPSQSVIVPDPPPTVEPATGPTLEVWRIKIRVPEKWRQTYNTPFVDAAQGRDGSVLLSVLATEQVSLDAAMKTFWNTPGPPRGFRRQETTVMGGLTAYYYTARTDDFSVDHVVGLWDSGYVVEINIGVDRDVPARRERKIVDSIIASYESPRTTV